jgi:hypothetical protein
MEHGFRQFTGLGRAGSSLRLLPQLPAALDRRTVRRTPALCVREGENFRTEFVLSTLAERQEPRSDDGDRKGRA